MLSESSSRDPQTQENTEGESRFPNLLSEFVYTRTYSRWLDDKNRRETWVETVDRYMDFIQTERPNVPLHVMQAARSAILNFQVMPSMRALWAAGPAAKRDNTCLYNCSFCPIDSIPAFSEALYILMQGTGVGFSVETRFTGQLPVVPALTGEVLKHTIEDSTEGWSDSLRIQMENLYRGVYVDFDYSGLRQRGAILKTKGGRASGPEPLERLHKLVARIFAAAVGRKLKPIECHDIACAIGDIVHVGGVRRAALISISDLDDQEMRQAKDWSQGDFPQIRYMANNSAFYEEKPSEEVFWKEWNSLIASRSGERGFFRMPPEKRKTRKGDFRGNPCMEILLRYLLSQNAFTGEGGAGSFCNLTAAVMRWWDTRETMADKVRLATWLGAIQASFTYFPYLRPGWEKICQEDRLLGVDITGHCDNPRLSGDPEVMLYLNRVAQDTAKEAARVLGIAEPAAITCGKPSGNSSQMLDCASGFHPRYAKYYIRRVRVDGKDPLTQMLRDCGMSMVKENGMDHYSDAECPVWVVEFPVKAPEGSMVRDTETALQQCQRYLQIMRTWCGEKGHNQSATIYVRDHEWMEVGAWLYEHFDEVCGLSFLPHDGGRYTLAPYEEITEAKFLELEQALPTVDFSLLSYYELEDRGRGSQELACAAGGCDL